MTPTTAHAVLRGQDVRFSFDDESKNWSFRIPSLNIVGGGDTRHDAERMAEQAIQFALEEAHESSAPWKLLVGLGVVGALATLLVRSLAPARSR